MKKVLVISDTHGRTKNLERILPKVQPIDYLLHLGDVGRDVDYIEVLAECPCCFVAGNNDYGRGLRDMCIIYIGEHKCLLTHGHRQHVHFGVDRLRYLALENECDIAMFGHTHVPFLEEASEDVTILNPGSISLPRQIGHEKTFLIMEIDDEENITYTFDHI